MRFNIVPLAALALVIAASPRLPAQAQDNSGRLANLFAATCASAPFGDTAETLDALARRQGLSLHRGQRTISLPPDDRSFSLFNTWQHGAGPSALTVALALSGSRRAYAWQCFAMARNASADAATRHLADRLPLTTPQTRRDGKGKRLMNLIWDVRLHGRTATITLTFDPAKSPGLIIITLNSPMP